MTIRFQTWRQQRAGNLDRLRLVTKPAPPEPGPREIRVAVRAVGLNFADIFACLGLYSATPAGEFTPGLEFAGTIDALGPDADTDTWKLGQPVMGVTRFGGYSSHILSQSEYLRPLPPGWDFQQGAAYLVQALTAWYGLSALGGIQQFQDTNQGRGPTTLIHSAAGGVGLSALRICQKFGAPVIATIGRPQKRALLEELGLPAEQIIVRSTKKGAKEIQAALREALEPVNRKYQIPDLPLYERPAGFDILFDSLGGEWFTPAVRELNPGGRHVYFGSGNIMNRGQRANPARLVWRYLRRPKADPMKMISANHSLLAFNLIWLYDKTQLMRRLLREMAENGLEKTPPLVGHRFNFEQAPDAIAAMQSGRTTGKVILELSGK